MIKIKETLVALSFLLVTNLAAQDPNFHIYICFGQSNMEGQGVVQNEDLTVSNRFKTFQAMNCSNLGRTKANWYTAVPPTCQCYSKLSPADYFGRTMVANLPDSITVGIINVAIGGCDIRVFDKDIYQDYDSTYSESWFTSKMQTYNYNPYRYLINLAQLAKQDGVIKGILLHQGETNTGQAMWPSYVKKIYNDMLTDLSLNANSVPLLAGEVFSGSGNCCGIMNTIINRLPDTIATAHVISSAGCTGQDNAHFNADGYRKLGRRYAVKMLSLMGYQAANVEPENGTGLMDDSSLQGYSLKQNHPNPVKGANTTISFEIPKRTYVSLKIINSNGVEIKELAGKKFNPGEHTVTFSPEKNLPPGIYYYKISADKFSATREMILSK